MSCFTELPASLFDKECVQIFFLVGGTLIGVVFWLYRKWRFHHLFTLGWGNGLGNISAIHTIPSSTWELRVTIKFHAPVSIEEFDLRFTKDMEHRPPPNTSNVPTSIIEILGIQDLDHLDPSKPQFFWVQDDGAGGRVGRYNPPYTRGKRDNISLRVWVHAKQEWQGYLSFRTLDPDGNRQYDYRSVQVKNILTLFDEAHSRAKTEADS